MDLANDLLEHAIELLSVRDNPKRPRSVDLRRATSACYYALFHQINQDAADLLAPHVTEATNHRIQRWFEHLKMKEICGRFTASPLTQPLLELIGLSASRDLQMVAKSFISLQDARHRADYDLSFEVTAQDAVQHLRTTVKAMEAWDRIQGTAEANIFILSLLMWKNWEDKTRP